MTAWFKKLSSQTARTPLAVLFAGAILPLSLAPFDFWPVGLLSLAIFFHCLRGIEAKPGLRIAFLFGLGYYGSGASWVFVSIHEFGNTPFVLAIIMTALFVAAMALVFCLPWCLSRFIPSHASGSKISNLVLAPFAFASLWLLGEWLRSWLFTGFPWLYVGYAHLHTPLAAWAPIGGVFALGFILALSASALAQYTTEFTSRTHNKMRRITTLLPLLFALGFWLTGAALNSHSWTQAKGARISVGMVQPNIPQELKWAPHFRQPTLDRLTGLSESLWQHDWVIWPEASVPLLYHEAQDFLRAMDERARAENSSLITGILYDDFSQQKYFNSVLGLGKAMGLYHKQRLVPFGEYVPLENWLRGLIDFFDLPHSTIYPGPSDQQGLLAGDVRIAPSICYEVVYPGLVAKAAANAEVLLTISNDAWFGGSIGPLQHMQMAQMRALESGRYMIRSTNNGVSGIIDDRGRITVISKQFELQTLSGEVYAMTGLTPFLKWGSAPWVIMSLLLLTIAGFRARH